MPKPVNSKPLEKKPDSGDLKFTEYIHALTSGNGSPSQHLFNAMWKKLLRVMRSQLTRRSLSGLPPSCLGVYGARSWSEKCALEDLAADCHQFVFLDRLEGMCAHLRVKQNVEGIVYRNIHYFFYEKQRRYDPLGFSVYVLLQRSVHLLLSDGSIHVCNEDRRIDSGSLLTFDTQTCAKPASADTISSKISYWREALLTDVALACGKNRHEVKKRLAQRILSLGEEGVNSFWFRDLYSVVSTESRSQLRAIWLKEQGSITFDVDGEEGSKIAFVNPDTSVEDREWAHKFIRSMSDLIDGLPEGSRRQAKTKVYLQKLWEFIKSAYLSEGGDCQNFSNRSLARQLSIPRERIAFLKEELQVFADQCRMKLRL